MHSNLQRKKHGESLKGDFFFKVLRAYKADVKWILIRVAQEVFKGDATFELGVKVLVGFQLVEKNIPGSKKKINKD